MFFHRQARLPLAHKSTPLQHTLKHTNTYTHIQTHTHTHTHTHKRPTRTVSFDKHSLTVFLYCAMIEDHSWSPFWVSNKQHYLSLQAPYIVKSRQACFEKEPIVCQDILHKRPDNATVGGHKETTINSKRVIMIPKQLAREVWTCLCHVITVICRHDLIWCTCVCLVRL